MNIEKLEVGELECNCYLLDINGSVLVIDPGSEAEKIILAIGNRKVDGIVVTHYHFDHIGALEGLINKYGVNVYDKSNLIEGENKIGNYVFDVIFTPGHKEDAITIYFKKEKIMFSGDFIFRDSIGRCDLLGGNIKDMNDSIKKLFNYDKDITLYPGHGDKTTLEYEFNNNIYIKNIR